MEFNIVDINGVTSNATLTATAKAVISAIQPLLLLKYGYKQLLK